MAPSEIVTPEQKAKLVDYYDRMVQAAKNPPNPADFDTSQQKELREAREKYLSNPFASMYANIVKKAEQDYPSDAASREAQIAEALAKEKADFVKGVSYGVTDNDVHKNAFAKLFSWDIVGAVKEFLLAIPMIGDTLAATGKWARSNVASLFNKNAERLTWAQARERITLEKAFNAGFGELGMGSTEQERGGLVASAIGEYERPSFAVTPEKTTAQRLQKIIDDGKLAGLAIPAGPMIQGYGVPEPMAAQMQAVDGEQNLLKALKRMDNPKASYIMVSDGAKVTAYVGHVNPKNEKEFVIDQMLETDGKGGPLQPVEGMKNTIVKGAFEVQGRLFRVDADGKTLLAKEAQKAHFASALLPLDPKGLVNTYRLLFAADESGRPKNTLSNEPASVYIYKAGEGKDIPASLQAMLDGVDKNRALSKALEALKKEGKNSMLKIVSDGDNLAVYVGKEVNKSRAYGEENNVFVPTKQFNLKGDQLVEVANSKVADGNQEFKFTYNQQLQRNIVDYPAVEAMMVGLKSAPAVAPPAPTPPPPAPPAPPKMPKVDAGKRGSGIDLTGRDMNAMVEKLLVMTGLREAPPQGKPTDVMEVAEAQRPNTPLNESRRGGDLKLG